MMSSVSFVLCLDDVQRVVVFRDNLQETLTKGLRATGGAIDDGQVQEVMERKGVRE
jgi:hypothetical protein